MRPAAQTAFGKALSLALPNTSIPDKAILSLARAVMAEAERGHGLAMDQASDPLREAMDELEETLNRTVPNARDRQAVFDVCARVAGAARDSVSAPQKDMESYATRSSATSGRSADPSTFGQNKNDWPSDVPSPFSTVVRRVPTGPGPTEDRRQAADAGAGALDALFAEFPAPLRLG